ncbi:hypothetical protein EI555_004822 [Monodon monoceros]|nr:hypothetical protein EI555_004822 [Monodon monoceros]
MRKFWL